MGCTGYTPSADSLEFAGKRIDGLPLHELARRGVALARQEPVRFEACP